jgi:putative acetyltransferase
MPEALPARPPVAIEHAATPDADVRALIGELDRELSRDYAPEQRHGLALDAIFQPHIRFFVARINGSAVGCGGIALFPDFAEIKRMYVRSAVRGHGVADAIMARLTTETRAAKLSTMRLETGSRALAAIRFYQRCGFQPCAAFEPYCSMAPHSIVTSVFLEKQLSRTGA